MVSSRQFFFIPGFVEWILLLVWTCRLGCRMSVGNLYRRMVNSKMLLVVKLNHIKFPLHPVSYPQYKDQYQYHPRLLGNSFRKVATRVIYDFSSIGYTSDLFGINSWNYYYQEILFHSVTCWYLGCGSWRYSLWNARMDIFRCIICNVPIG